VTVNTEGALDSSEARAFLSGFDDDVFFFLAVGVCSWIFAVFFAAVFAAGWPHTGAFLPKTTVALATVGSANARQVLGYEQEAKP
jgi:hypothetical protein